MITKTITILGIAIAFVIGLSINNGVEGGAEFDCDNCIDKGDLGKNAVGKQEIKRNAVGASEIKQGAVRSDEIAVNAVGAPELATNAVGADEIQPMAVGSDKIAVNAVGNIQIATNAVGADEIGTDAVGADEIAGISKLIFGECKITSGSLYNAGETKPFTCLVSGLEATDSVVLTMKDQTNECFSVVQSDLTFDGSLRWLLRNNCGNAQTDSGYSVQYIVFEN